MSLPRMAARTLIGIAMVMMLWALAGCVDVEVDPEPPYPLHPYDYDYPEDEQLGPPWDHPEDFPVVAINQPGDGDFVSAGNVTVSGTYAGPELASLTINGSVVELVSNAFTAQLLIAPGDVALPITVTATTTEAIVASDAVTVFEGSSATWDTLVTDGLLIDLENDGLNAISGLASSLLDGIDLTGGMKQRLDKALLDLTTAYIGNIDLQFTSKDDGLEVEILAGGVELVLEILGQDLTIDIDGLFASVLAEIIVDTNNKLVLTTVDAKVSLASWEMDIPLLPDAVDEVLSLLTRLILPALIDALIEGPVTTILNTVLAGLDIQITTDTFTYGLLPSLVQTNARNMVLGFDSRIDLLDAFDPEFQTDGFRMTASSAPVFNETTPATGQPYGIGLGIGDDMLNQVFYALCASGTLNFELVSESLTAETMSLLFFSFEDIDPPDAPIVLAFAPSVAPVFRGDPVTSTLYMNLPGYTGQILVDRGAPGRWEAISFAVDITAPLSLMLNDDDSFSLRLGDLDLGFRILHNAVGQRNVENMENLFAELFDEVLPDLLAGLEDMSLKLPELLGLTITIPDLTLFGPGDDYLGLFLGLEYN